MEYMLSLCIILVEILSLINVSNAFLIRKISKKNFFLVTIIYIIFNCIVFSIALKDLNILRFILVLICNYIYTVIVYKGNLGRRIISVLVSYIFNFSCELFTIFTTTYIVGLNIYEIRSSVTAYTILSIISKFLLYVVTFLFERIWSYKENKSDISAIEWIQMLVFPVISFFVLILMLILSINIKYEFEFFGILLTTGIFIANIITLVLISRLSLDKKVKQDNMILNQQIKMSMDNVDTLMTAYADQRRLTHDFNNHINTLHGLIKQNNINSALNYLNKMQISASTMIVKSNNNIVDAILNYKYAIANKNNIIMTFDINDLSNVNIHDEDIVTILGNALDNAIEACLKCVDNRRIKIKIKHIEDETIIIIKNTVSESIETNEENLLKTTKENRIEHGYGIKNICAILDKYEHIFNINCNDGWFVMNIIVY